MTIAPSRRLAQRKRYELALLRGQKLPTSRVPIDETRTRIHELLERGWSIHRVALEAGVDPSVISRVNSGKLRYTQKSVHDRVLVAYLRVMAEEERTRPARVPAEPTVTLLRSLHRIGWTREELQARLQKYGVGKNFYVRSGQANVEVEIADAVKALWHELCMVPGPSNRARAIAKNKGWRAPLDLEV